MNSPTVKLASASWVRFRPPMISLQYDVWAARVHCYHGNSYRTQHHMPNQGLGTAKVYNCSISMKTYSNLIAQPQNMTLLGSVLICECFYLLVTTYVLWTCIVSYAIP